MARAFIVTTFIGSFGIDEENRVIFFKPFPKKPDKIAEKLKLSEIEIIEEEKQLQTELWKKGFKEFVYSVRKYDVKNVEPDSKAEQFVKGNLRKIAIEKKFVKDQIEFNQLLTKVNIELTKVKIKRAIGRDGLIIHFNGAIEELDKSINVFVERLREIYGMHFPEMDRIVSDHQRFAEIIDKYGSRDKIEDPDLKQFAQKSMGMDIEEDDVKAVQLYASKIIELYKFREGLSGYLEKLVKEMAPNFTGLAGFTLAAKLIAKAGGLERLARMPSSTIQLIGAEKALFRFLHGRGKSPRFGILYSHPLIQNAPEKLKGRVARVLASKLSIAAKMDFYSKKYKSDKLSQELEKRIREIMSSR